MGFHIWNRMPGGGALLEVLELEGSLGNKFLVDDGQVVFGPEARVVAPVAGADELLLEDDEHAVVHADLVCAEQGGFNHSKD